MDSGEFKTFLIYGVTGSGKTLVYLHNIRKAINSGKGVLILVPEISLTPQLIDRFEKSFAGMVSILHSKMTDYERVYSWRQIASGKVKIVLGARSALFAPIQNLGIIIVDEEHEQSYKQESPAPRYNARDAAIVRAKNENAVIVLGSATPSIESMYNTMNGKYELLNLKQRADGAEMPFVRVIDMIDSMKKGKVINSFSKVLLDMIEDRLAKNEGVILFQNRRGFSTVLICKSCAHTPECIHCSIKLTYHKSRNILKCHYCGYTVTTPNSCLACEDGEYEISGYGTQRIEQELKEYLESKNIQTNIERLDLDSTTAKDSQRRILERFYTGETSILVGTQMVAKGLNFDRVTLVGVINSDIQLFMPDFRASERTFQLLTQVSGRAGRKRGMLGQVIIQTYNADNYAIKYAAAADYIGFYNREIEIRFNSFYPPFTRFITLEFYGTEEDKTANYASTFRAYLPKSSNDIEILGPVIPTIFKMRNNFRRVIIIKSLKDKDKSGAFTRNLIRKALAACSLKFSIGTVMMKIDIDSFAGV
jgi:primosomal protein N' (replication factor Y)